MSDPAKTPEEIEDVLASIRRLVSDHGSGSGTAPPQSLGTTPTQSASAHNAAHPAASASTASPKRADALVLSPSFRVSDPDDPWAPVAASTVDPDGSADTSANTGRQAVDTPAALASDAILAPTMSSSGDAGATEPGTDWHPEDRLAHFDTVGLDEAVPHGGDPDEPIVTDLDADHLTAGPHENSDDVDMFDTITSSDEDISDLISLDGASHTPDDYESETGDENWPGEGAEAALLTLVARRDPVSMDPAPQAASAAPLALTDPIMSEAEAKAEAPVPTPGEAADPTQPDEHGLPDRQTVPNELAEADMSGGAESTPGDASDDDRGIEPGSASGSPSDPIVPIFSRRPAVKDTDTTPDSIPDDHTPFAAEIDDFEAASPFSLPDSEDGILDEDTLREIIVDVVREELQGVLGQRITRNVRKMVRREIRLALAAEDLD